MCHPAAFVALAVIQAQQENAAANTLANQTNAAAAEAEQAELDAYKRDMGSYWEEETDLIADGYRSAEEAADERLNVLIEAKQRRATLVTQNLETNGGGQTADSIIAQHTRSLASTTRDLEDNYQRGVTSRRRELKNMQRDKESRRYSAISAINGLPRSGKASLEAEMGNVVMAGVSGYTTGKNITQKKGPATSQRGATYNSHINADIKK
tara:strand:- start:8974 stop:9603 length:630 start_codon:yes stop_codon:yes gene_type:complete